MFPFAHNHNSLRIPLRILNLQFAHNHNSLRLVRKSDCKPLYSNLLLIRELPRPFASGSLAAAATILRIKDFAKDYQDFFYLYCMQILNRNISLYRHQDNRKVNSASGEYDTDW